MSGHSHWATIKRKKGAADAKKGKIFTRIAREIVLAAREGGGDPGMNVRLELAIDKAKAANMPKDSIDRAIKRGTGEDKEGVSFEEILYEGFAPNGVALMIECTTENRNRTVAELRHILSRSGGGLGDPGSVSWQFDRMTYFAIPSDNYDFDSVFEVALEAGADDINEDDGLIEIVGAPNTFGAIADHLSKANIKPEESGIRYMPKQEVFLDVEHTIKVLKTIESLEELDDVMNIYSNLDISEEALQAMEND
ncbi:MAG: YebC/PmpR family DNA-binding transcriptional regulator [Anaerolineaceae bacterium]|jgi:YebC/PmpR family DNA-binding regulatory protein|nr:YebC/PmpR family DNA-binding transcriptional regulator [Anaerolineaceae bacterium]